MAASLHKLTKYLFSASTSSLYRKDLSIFTTRAVSNHWQRLSVNKKQFVRLLSGAGVFGASVSLILYGHQRIPVVYAASVDNDQKRPSRREMANFIADVVEKTAPAVVYIEIQGRHPFTGQKMTLSNGSGFIVRADGLILTNAHVVANKTSVKVKLSDGRIVDGSVQAVDRMSDLATVKVNQTGLPILPLGSSASVRPGEWVIAMGSPFQLNNTVTAGIVSSRARGSRELGMTSSDIEYIQTDANINFGNSGGPLINLDGEAIGINTLKVTTGISFAIPSDYAREFLQKAEQLERRKTPSSWFGKSSAAKQAPVKRYMGISMLTLTPSIIQELQMRHGPKFANIDTGVLVHRVTVGSPAHESGILPGDVIVSINDKPVKASSDVFEALSSSSELRIVFYRGQKRLSSTVSAEEVDS